MHRLVHFIFYTRIIDQKLCLYYNNLMKEKIYYYDGKIKVNEIVSMIGDEFHHLEVMRARVGETLCLINGDKNFYYGKIQAITKKSAEILIEKSMPSINEPQVSLTVYQALAKGDKLSTVTQKISEIGATTLKLFESKYTDVKGDKSNFERLKNIAISASKQCERASILEISGTINVAQIASEIPNFDEFFVAYENHDGKTLTDELLQAELPKTVALVIGPEGGFAQDEIELFKRSGAKIVSLGKRILRTETAAILGAGLIMQIIENSKNC